jgi:hypothetical protein
MLGYLSQPDFQISSRLRQAATEAKIIGSSTETYNYESDWQTKLTGLCFARPVELLKDQKLKTAAGIGYRTYYDFTLKENIKVTDAYSGYETDYTYTGG